MAVEACAWPWPRARACLAYTVEYMYYYYKTVNTRRHRLKQPKFVLRCTQLQVGLPHAIGVEYMY